MRVWKGSSIYQHITESPFLSSDCFILGDSAYPCTSFLITPFKDNGHLTRRQRRFNYFQSSIRVVIEQAFGILKGKFRRLRYLNMKRIDLIPTVITACCILHNVCLEEGDEVQFRPVIDAGGDQQPIINNTATGTRRRENLLSHIQL